MGDQTYFCWLCESQCGKEQNPYPYYSVTSVTDPRIRVRIKTHQIRNTDQKLQYPFEMIHKKINAATHWSPFISVTQ
jgi:hypothetical protein